MASSYESKPQKASKKADASSKSSQEGVQQFQVENQNPTHQKELEIVGMVQRQENRTGMPGGLKRNIDSATTSKEPIQLRETHRIRKDVTPFIHEFTQDAIDHGAPKRLTYLINKASSVYVQDSVGGLHFKESVDQSKIGTEYFAIGLHELNRLKALGKGSQLVGKSKKYEKDLSRDEYPYASTFEGGTDSFWSYVPKTEQSSQGGSLAGLYRRVIQSGDPEFDVELD